MREIRQSGSEGGGNEQTVSPYPYISLCPFGANTRSEAKINLLKGSRLGIRFRFLAKR